MDVHAAPAMMFSSQQARCDEYGFDVVANLRYACVYLKEIRKHQDWVDGYFSSIFEESSETRTSLSRWGALPLYLHGNMPEAVPFYEDAGNATYLMFLKSVVPHIAFPYNLKTAGDGVEAMLGWHIKHNGKLPASGKVAVFCNLIRIFRRLWNVCPCTSLEVRNRVFCLRDVAIMFNAPADVIEECNL